jgi:hypothetical protein
MLGSTNGRKYAMDSCNSKIENVRIAAIHNTFSSIIRSYYSVMLELLPNEICCMCNINLQFLYEMMELLFTFYLKFAIFLRS